MDRYDIKQFDPPAPIIMVEVSNPYEGTSEKKKGKIDTGADISVIPDEWIKKLKLRPAGDVDAYGYDGRGGKELTYYVNISFDTHSFYTEVISKKRKNVLIGRDILNRLRILLDGKNLIYKIEDP